MLISIINVLLLDHTGACFKHTRTSLRRSCFHFIFDKKQIFETTRFSPGSIMADFVCSGGLKVHKEDDLMNDEVPVLFR